MEMKTLLETGVTRDIESQIKMRGEKRKDRQMALCLETKPPQMLHASAAVDADARDTKFPKVSGDDRFRLKRLGS